MKKRIFQLKKRFKFNNLTALFYKKPLFTIVCAGLCLSAAVVIYSVSGMEKAGFKSELTDLRGGPASVAYTGNGQDTDDDEYEEYQPDPIERGDSLSASQYTRTEKSSASTRKPGSGSSVQPTSAPTVTPVPEATPEPSAEPTEEPIIEEPPAVTDSPEITEEPEVELDPYGPVIVSSMEEKHFTASFIESLKLTGYNSAGDKLSKDHFTVLLNGETLLPYMTSGQSVYYYLNYPKAVNIIDVIITDDNNVSKEYQFYSYYHEPNEPHAIISVEADVLGLGYIVEPTLVYTEEGKNLANYVKTLLSEKGYTTFSSGSQNNNYRFKGLYKSGLYKNFGDLDPDLSDYINNTLMIPIMNDNYYTDFVRNGYFTTVSAWMFEVNGELHSDSLSDYTLVNKDVFRLRFSLANGADLQWMDEQRNAAATGALQE